MVRLAILIRTRSPSLHRHDVDPREDARIEGPDVEVRHLGDLGERGSWIETIGAHDEGEVTIDAPEPRSLGCTTNMPIIPMAICTISSE